MKLLKNAVQLIDRLRGRDNVTFLLRRKDGTEAAVYSEGDKTFSSPDVPRRIDVRTA